jgi:hypothetical protein
LLAAPDAQKRHRAGLEDAEKFISLRRQCKIAASRPQNHSFALRGTASQTLAEHRRFRA